MNIRILLGTFIIVLVNKLNGRFLLVNVGDPNVDDDDRHRIGDLNVDDDNDRPRMGKIEIEKGLSCGPVKWNCIQNHDCCSGLCQGEGARMYGECAEKNDGTLKKEGEACGQSCDVDCGNCEDGLTCALSLTEPPTCKCGFCTR